MFRITSSCLITMLYIPVFVNAALFINILYLVEVLNDLILYKTMRFIVYLHYWSVHVYDWGLYSLV